jgi:hypothetical protein
MKMSANSNDPEIGKVANHIETYKVIAEWIRFADAKAAATLTVNGVLLGLLIPTLKTYLTEKAVHPTAWWAGLVVVLFLIWLVLLVVSAIFAFLCILPFRGQGRRLALDRTAHFHPAAVARSYSLNDPDRFIGNAEKAGREGLNREVLVAILIDSHLSNAKYGYVTRSIWALAGSVFFGFLYLLATQL